MEVAFALLADQAVVPPDGKFYILGGGFDQLSPPELPGRVAFVVVAAFRFQRAEVVNAADPAVVEVRLVDGQGKLVMAPSTVSVPPETPFPAEADEILLKTTLPIVAMVGSPGRYAIEFVQKGTIVHRIPIPVVERSQIAPAVGPRPN